MITPQAQSSVGLDVSSLAPIASYVICTNPRSGSWLLSEALSSTAIAGNPREWFNIAEEQYNSARWHIKYPDISNFSVYLGNVLARAKTSNGIVGIKLHYYQFADLAKRLAAIDDIRVRSLSQSMSLAFPNIKYIWLTRRDKGRQAISYYKALNTGEWWKIGGIAPIRQAQANNEITLEPTAIQSLEQTLWQNDQNWQAYFKEHEISPYLIYYEDLASDYTGTIKDVLKWLDIGNAENVPIRAPRLKRQSDAKTEAWLASYIKFKKTTAHNESQLTSVDDTSLTPANAIYSGPAIPVTSPLFKRTQAFRERQSRLPFSPSGPNGRLMRANSARIVQRPERIVSCLNACPKLSSMPPGRNVIERRIQLPIGEFREQKLSLQVIGLGDQGP